MSGASLAAYIALVIITFLQGPLTKTNKLSNQYLHGIIGKLHSLYSALMVMGTSVGEGASKQTHACVIVRITVKGPPQRSPSFWKPLSCSWMRCLCSPDVE